MSQPVENPRITCEYGKKGSAWACGFHSGTDYGARVGDAIMSIADGTVIHAGKDSTMGSYGAYGFHVIVESKIPGYDKPLRIIYAHMSKLGTKKGATVKAGAKIGEAGATGNTFGVHLHLEAREHPYKYAVDAVDVVPIIKELGAKAGAVKKTATAKKG